MTSGIDGGATKSHLNARVFCAAFCLTAFHLYPGLAQVPTSPITSSSLNTQISAPTTLPSGQINYNITGGTRLGGGTNLFHSFGNFNVPTNNIANFLNETALPTSNILGRVTGGNISNIFGSIQTTGFGGANLFLMNPAGFLFGPNATINVGGMVAFTSADYLRLADGVRFNATPNATADALLSTAPVLAYGFLGSNPGAITVQGSQLTVTDGTGISLVGGNITIQPGTLTDGTVQPAKVTAPGGQINLASVASPGEILRGTLDYAPNVSGQSFGALGTIQISQKSVIDASGDGGGTVIIRGGRFVLDDSRISANVTGPATGQFVGTPGEGIDIKVTGDAVIQNEAVLETNVMGDFPSAVGSGGVRITADRIQIIGSTDFDTVPFTGINSSTQGAGSSGNISLKANGNIELTNIVFLQSTSGFDSAGISTSATRASGNAGVIELRSAHGNILFTDGDFSSMVTSQTFNSSGNTGKITMSAPEGDVTIDAAFVFTFALPIASGRGGAVEITAKNLQMNSGIVSTDNFGPLKPDGITMTVSDNLTVTGGSVIATASESVTGAPAGNINIAAKDAVVTQGSLITSSTFASGPGGHISILADTLQVTDGALIASGSTIAPPIFFDQEIIPSGAGGTITVQGLGRPAQSILIDGQGSGIFTNAEGTGAGGNIFVNANSVTLQNGGTLSAATSGTAASATGGTITVDATNAITMNSASITASSTGPADAGSINITALNGFTMQNSSIRTEVTPPATSGTSSAGGGNIKITTSDAATLELVNSKIIASVADGLGGGGNISIDPQFVILQNSQILAQAAQGQGGAITITANLFLPDANSIVNADSGSGVNGTVTIQSPNDPAGGKIQPLGKSPLLATSLLNQRCASLAGGEFSSFTVAERDRLPTEPGSWLASPLVLGPAGFNAGTVTVGGGRARVIDPAHETTVVSLRQIAPTGFLTQAFAVDWSASCES